MYSENRKELVKNLKDYKDYVEFLADAILSLEQILVKGELTLDK